MQWINNGDFLKNTFSLKNHGLTKTSDLPVSALPAAGSIGSCYYANIKKKEKKQKSLTVNCELLIDTERTVISRITRDRSLVVCTLWRCKDRLCPVQRSQSRWNAF